MLCVLLVLDWLQSLIACRMKREFPGIPLVVVMCPSAHKHGINVEVFVDHALQSGDLVNDTTKVCSYPLSMHSYCMSPTPPHIPRHAP